MCKLTPREMILQKHWSRSVDSSFDLADKYTAFELDKISSIVFGRFNVVFRRQPANSSPLKYNFSNQNKEFINW